MNNAERPSVLLLPPARVANRSRLIAIGLPLGSLVREANAKRLQIGQRPLVGRGLYGRHRSELDLVYTHSSFNPAEGTSFLVLPEDRSVTERVLLEMTDGVRGGQKSPSGYEANPGTFSLSDLVKEANVERRKQGMASLRVGKLIKGHPELGSIFHKSQTLHYVFSGEKQEAVRWLINLPNDRIWRGPSEAGKYCEKVLYPGLASEFKGKVPTEEEVISWTRARAEKQFSRKVPPDEREDLMQEALLRLFPYLTGREGVINHSALEIIGLIWKTCHNLICEHYRRKEREPEVGLLESIYAVGKNWEDKCFSSLPPGYLEEAGLTKIQQRVISLRLIGDLRYQQIAEILNGEDSGNHDRASVQGVFNRGKVKLRAYLVSLGITSSDI